MGNAWNARYRIPRIKAVLGDNQLGSPRGDTECQHTMYQEVKPSYRTATPLFDYQQVNEGDEARPTPATYGMVGNS